MIFVVLGTWGMPFPRALIKIEELVKNSFVKEDVVVQAGNTDYTSKYFQIHKFFDKETFDKYYLEANFIISQAGVGSIMNGLKFNKKVIAIARLERYKEHIDDHQLEILSTFSSKGYILSWNENDFLLDVISRLKEFNPQQYPFQQGKISETIINFLENKK